VPVPFHASANHARLRSPRFGLPAAFAEIFTDRQQRPEFEVPLKDVANPRRLSRVDDEAWASVRAVDVVPERRRTAAPFAPLLRRRDLVPDALADDLTLELGERQEDVEREPAHRMGRVEVLGNRDERNLVAIKDLHEAREVHQRPGQTVHLVDHHAVDLARLDVGHQALEARPIDVAPRESAVVVSIGKR